jgi:DNA modification methylase
VEFRPVEGLVPYARNARTHDARQLAQIAASMREWGWTNPVLVEPDGGVIAGHGRILAAERVWQAGGAIARCPDGQVPCIVVSGLSAAQKAALVLADNRIALSAGWDMDLLKAELGMIDGAGLDAAITGFTAEELQELLAQPFLGETDPDDAPPAEEVAVSVIGDVWALGEHRLVCGDCTRADHVSLCLGSERPKLMVTDPPYGVNYDPSWRRKAGVGSAGAAEGKVLNDDRADWRDAWALFPGSVAYVWHAGLHADAVAQSLRSVKFAVRAQIVWVKTRHVLSRGDYHPQHEPALYAVREGEADDGWRFVPEHEVAAYVVREGVPGGYRGGRKQSTVWFIEHLKSDTGHGTQKPVEAMKRPIENNSAPGDLVYEPFSGSGTTLVACQMTGRRGRAIELDPRYVDVAVRRWEAFVGAKAALVVAGDGGSLGGLVEVAARRRVAS